jgi:hypothetical protein
MQVESETHDHREVNVQFWKETNEHRISIFEKTRSTILITSKSMSIHCTYSIWINEQHRRRHNETVHDATTIIFSYCFMSRTDSNHASLITIDASNEVGDVSRLTLLITTDSNERSICSRFTDLDSMMIIDDDAFDSCDTVETKMNNGQFDVLQRPTTRHILVERWVSMWTCRVLSFFSLYFIFSTWINRDI